MVSQVLVVALAAFSIIISNEIFSECARHVFREIMYIKRPMQITIHGKADHDKFIAIPLPAEYRTPSIDQMKMMMSIYDHQQFKEGSLRFCLGKANGNRDVLIFPCEPSVYDETENYSAELIRMFLDLSPTNLSGPIVICFLQFVQFRLYKQGFYSGQNDDITFEISDDKRKPLLEANFNNSENCSILPEDMMIETFMGMIDDDENESQASEIEDSHSEPLTFSINNDRSNVTIRIPNSDFSKMVMTMDDASSYIQNLCPDQAVELMQQLTSLLRKRLARSSVRTLTPDERRERILAFLNS